jgi:hypothetical protein
LPRVSKTLVLSMTPVGWKVKRTTLMKRQISKQEKC